MTGTPKLVGIEQVADGWLKKYVLRYRLEDGTEIGYDAVSRKGPDAFAAELHALGNEPGHRNAVDAVCIVPRTEDGRLVLIREFRYALNSWVVSFPAGLVEPGEPIEAAVERELAEETGFAPLRNPDGTLAMYAPAQPSLTSAGMTEEAIQLVFVQVENEPSLGQHLDDIEHIQTFTLSRGELPRFLAENTTPIGTRAQLIIEALAGNIRW